MTSQTVEQLDTISAFDAKSVSKRGHKLNHSFQLVHSKNDQKKHVFKFDYI